MWFNKGDQNSLESGLKRPMGNELCRRLHPNDSRNPFSFTVVPQGVMVWGRGTAPAVDRVLSLIACLRRISPLIFHTARTLSGSLRSPPSPRGEGFVRPYCFSTHACIRSDNARKAIHAKCDQNPRLLMRRASTLNPSTYEAILLFAR